MTDSACKELLESRVPEFDGDISSILSSCAYSGKELRLAVKNNVLISEADDGIYALDLKLVDKIYYTKELKNISDNEQTVKYTLHAAFKGGEEEVPVREHGNIELAEALIIDLLIYIEDTYKGIEVDLGGIKSSLY